MSLAEVGSLLVATLQAVGVGAVFILVLMIGASLALDVFKLRPSGRKSLTVRSLDEALGRPESYLPASTPRGTTDQLGNSQHAA
jgi:hypothetical protein